MMLVYSLFQQHTSEGNMLLLLMIIHCVSSGQDFIAQITVEAHADVVGLNVARHIVLPIVGIVAKGALEQPGAQLVNIVG